MTIHVNSVGVQTIAAAGTDFQLVPNPNKGAFTIKGNIGSGNEETVSIQITNMMGQVIYTATTTAHNGLISEQVSLTDVPANGMYLVTIHSANGTSVFHMEIEQ